MTHKQFIALKADDAVIYKSMPYVFRCFTPAEFAIIASQELPLKRRRVHYKKIALETKETTRHEYTD